MSLLAMAEDTGGSHTGVNHLQMPGVQEETGGRDDARHLCLLSQEPGTNKTFACLPP